MVTDPTDSLNWKRTWFDGNIEALKDLICYYLEGIFWDWCSAQCMVMYLKTPRN